MGPYEPPPGRGLGRSPSCQTILMGILHDKRETKLTNCKTRFMHQTAGINQRCVTPTRKVGFIDPLTPCFRGLWYILMICGHYVVCSIHWPPRTFAWSIQMLQQMLQFLSYLAVLLTVAYTGTPLHVVVDEVDKGYVTAYGSGLSLGLSGKECTFHVVGSSSKLLSYQLIHTYVLH